MKKHIWKIICLAIIVAVVVYVLYPKGKTSGTIKLFVDGTEIAIDGIPIDFSYVNDSDGNVLIKNSLIKNGNFEFNKSKYAVYLVSFSLKPDLWGEIGQAVKFEVQYFCTYDRAITEFDIKINILSNEGKTIELIASEGNSTISSGEIPIDSLGMTISVFIPSP